MTDFVIEVVEAPAVEIDVSGPGAALAAFYAAEARAVADPALGIESARGLVEQQPNLFTAAELNFTDKSRLWAGVSDTAAATVAALPCWQLTSAASNTKATIWRLPRSLLGSATTFSASILVLAASPASTGTGSARYLIIQRDAGLTEVARSTVTLCGSEGVLTQTRFRHAAVAVHASCVQIDFHLDIATPSGATTRLLSFRDMLLVAGPNASFRLPYDGARASTAEAQAGTDPLKLMVPSTTREAIQVRDAVAMNDNVYPDPLFATATASALSVGWSGNWSMASKNGAVALETISSASAVNNSSPLIDITQFKSKRLSISCVIREKIGDQGAANLRIRIRAHSVNAQGTIITSSGLWPTEGNDDVANRNTQYTRYIPQSDITAPTQLVVCENLDLTAAVAAGALWISIDIRVQTTVQAWVSHICFREGADPTWKSGSSLSGAATPVAYVGPSGSDSSGTGTALAPYATANKALDAIGGNGTVVIMAGSTYGPTMRVTPTKVRGRVVMTGEVSSYALPVIRMAAKLTGITKTAGQTKIYQATVAGLPTLTNFQWAYQDGVADPRTVIDLADRSPQHRGRTNRLMNVAKLVKTAAVTLANAKTEMDASSLPLAFIDGGILYFTIVGGGDGTAADIYLDASVGLIASGTRESCGELIVQNLDVRYGGIDARPFRRAGLDNVVATGSRFNVVDYSVLVYRSLEVSCGGSQSQFNGDGLNGHIGAVIQSGDDLYAHDCWDDGFSDHEGCTSRMMGGGLCEYNGGSALVPAFGSDHVSRGFVSRRNQQRAGWKPGAFAAIGNPTGGSPADGGVDTRARFIGHVSLDDTVGFYDESASQPAYAECIDCLAVNSSTHGYDVGPALTRCDYAGTGTAKSGRTTQLTTARA